MIVTTADNTDITSVQNLDGKKVGQGNVGKFVGTVSDAQVGTKNRGKDGAALSGQWSHYAIFGSALSEARIVAHHAAGVAPAQPAQRGVSWDFGGPMPSVSPSRSGG